MKYLPVLIIVILLVVAVVVIQDVFRSKPIVNNQTHAPSKINSTITAINSLKNNTALPQKAVRKTPNVPPIPLKK